MLAYSWLWDYEERCLKNQALLWDSLFPWLSNYMEKKKVDEISRPLMTRSNPGDKFIVAYCLMYRSDMVPKDDEFCEVECSCSLHFCFSCLSEIHSPGSCLMWELATKKC